MYLIWQISELETNRHICDKKQASGKISCGIPKRQCGVGEMWNMYTPPDAQWSRRVTEEGGLIGREREGTYKALVDTSHKRGRSEFMEWWLEEK